jgi:hypothetical protein
MDILSKVCTSCPGFYSYIIGSIARAFFRCGFACRHFVIRSPLCYRSGAYLDHSEPVSSFDAGMLFDGFLQLSAYHHCVCDGRLTQFFPTLEVL